MCSAFDWKELDCFPFSSPHAGQSSAQSSKVRIKLAIITPTYMWYRVHVFTVGDLLPGLVYCSRNGNAIQCCSSSLEGQCMEIQSSGCRVRCSEWFCLTFSGVIFGAFCLQLSALILLQAHPEGQQGCCVSEVVLAGWEALWCIEPKLWPSEVPPVVANCWLQWAGMVWPWALCGGRRLVVFNQLLLEQLCWLSLTCWYWCQRARLAPLDVEVTSIWDCIQLKPGVLGSEQPQDSLFQEL